MAKKLKGNRSGVKTVKENLPSDIIEANILTRLPVKTLIRFTAVCKTWYSLLSDPYFINIYNLIQKNKTSNLLLLNLNDDNRFVVTDSCSMEKWSSFNEDCSSFKLVDVVGCCDGIVCVLGTYFNESSLTNDGLISLWNPALRINKIVTSYDQTLGSIDPAHFCSLCIGFGYHNQANDYKIIKFVNDSWTLKHVEIYSLNSNSWRSIELDSSQFLTNKYAVQHLGVYVSCSLGGSYYWPVRKMDHNEYFCECCIISFDTQDEVFNEMTLPYTTNHLGRNTLFSYKDSLAVLHTHDSDAFNPYSSKICYIWVMKEYNDPTSWSMLCKFDSQRPYVSFMGVIKTDMILLLGGDLSDWWCPINKEVNVVDTEKSQMKSMSSCTKDNSFSTEAWRVSCFTESLALLKGGVLKKFS